DVGGIPAGGDAKSVSAVGLGADGPAIVAYRGVAVRGSGIDAERRGIAIGVDGAVGAIGHVGVAVGGERQQAGTERIAVRDHGTVVADDGVAERTDGDRAIAVLALCDHQAGVVHLRDAVAGVRLDADAVLAVGVDLARIDYRGAGGAAGGNAGGPVVADRVGADEPGVVRRGGTVAGGGDHAIGAVVLAGVGADGDDVAGVDDGGVAGLGQGQRAVGQTAGDRHDDAAVLVVDRGAGVANRNDAVGTVAVFRVLLGINIAAVADAGGAALVQRQRFNAGSPVVALADDLAGIVHRYRCIYAVAHGVDARAGEASGGVAADHQAAIGVGHRRVAAGLGIDAVGETVGLADGNAGVGHCGAAGAANGVDAEAVVAAASVGIAAVAYVDRVPALDLDAGDRESG